MNLVAQAARRLVEHRPGHRMVSLYLDLDPERFATPPARASQIDSLIDEARKELERTDGLSHEDHMALREDLKRVHDYLLSDDPPFQGAQALAVFCSVRDDLFETVRLSQPVTGLVRLDGRPFVEPMVSAAQQRDWCVVLVNSRTARVLTGPSDRLSERQDFDDAVHGRHHQGGWSQARYERSVDKDIDDHLRHVAEVVELRLRRDGFDRLALGGPSEVVPRLEEMLSHEVRSRLAPGRVEVDVSTTGEDEIRAAVADLVARDETHIEHAALQAMADGIGSGGRGAGGPEDTVEALNERRVQTLLLAPDFDRPARRCAACGLIVLGSERTCPADGSELEDVDLREAVVEAALAQDAQVLVVRHHPDLETFRGIGAVLRF